MQNSELELTKPITSISNRLELLIKQINATDEIVENYKSSVRNEEKNNLLKTDFNSFVLTYEDGNEVTINLKPEYYQKDED